MNSRKHEARIAGGRIANQFTVLAIGEILIILWLVIMGARTTPLEGQLSESGNRVADDA